MYHRKKRTHLTSATKLAEMGLCERKVHLRAIHGDMKKNATREAAMKRGRNVHAKAELGDYKEHKEDKRCFIATCIYGQEAVETRALRLFRDQYLKRSIAGRMFVEGYYLFSPTVVKVLEKSNVLRRLTEAGLNIIVRKVSKVG